MPRDVRIVGGRLSRCCVVRRFGLYNPVSLKIYITTMVADIRVVTRFWGVMRACMQKRDLTATSAFFEIN